MYNEQVDLLYHKAKNQLHTVMVNCMLFANLNGKRLSELDGAAMTAYSSIAAELQNIRRYQSVKDFDITDDIIVRAKANLAKAEMGL